MAATIDTTTRFTEVTIYFNPFNGAAHIILWRTDTSPQVRGVIDLINGQPPVAGTDDADDLAVLQEIYDSTNKFQNADGDSITVNIQDAPLTTDIDELETYNYPNPFIAGFNTRRTTQVMIDGALLQDGDFERDETTGKPTVGFEGEWQVKARRPDGSDFDASLASWEIGYTSDDIFRLRLEIPSTEQITKSKLRTHTPVRAMLAWWQSKKTSGANVGSDASDPATILGGGRQFTFAQEDGDSDIVVDYNFHWVVTDSDDINVVLYIYEFERQSGASIDADKLSALLTNTTISIANTEQVAEDGVIGGHETVVKSKELDFNTWKLKPSQSGIIISGQDTNAKRFSFPIVVPRTVDYTDLPAHPITTTYKTIPQIWLFNTIHYLGTTATSFRFPNPSEMIGQQGTHRTIAFHNISDIGGNGVININDWNNDLLIALRPTEYVNFQVTLEGEGNGGKIIGLQVPPRRFESENHPADISGAPHFGSVPYWHVGSSLDFRMVPFSTSDVRYRDDDTFRYSSNSAPTGNQDNLNDETNFDFQGNIQITRPGIVNVELELHLQTLSSATGNIGGYNRMRIYRLKASGNNPASTGDDRGFGLSGGNAREEYAISRSIRVEANDRIMPTFGYYTSGISLNSWNKLRVAELIWNMTMTSHIEQEWTS